MNLSISRDPIDKQSSKIFWKAPWWAKAPPEDKDHFEKVLEKALEIVDYKTLLNYTNPPPTRIGDLQQQIKDKRGYTVLWSSGSTGVVLGYAEAQKKPYKGTRMRRAIYWWVLSTDNQITMVRDLNLGKGTRARFIPPGDCDHLTEIRTHLHQQTQP